MRIQDIIMEQEARLVKFPITKAEFVKWLESGRHTDFDPSTIRLDKYNNVVAKLNRRLKGNKFTLYRAVSIFERDDPVEWIQKNSGRIGTSWTWDKESAIPYRFKSSDWEIPYIIAAEVEPEDIDIFMTLALNLTVVRGDYEREIRLNNGAIVEIVSIGEVKLNRKKVKT